MAARKGANGKKVGARAKSKRQRAGIGKPAAKAIAKDRAEASAKKGVKKPRVGTSVGASSSPGKRGAKSAVAVKSRRKSTASGKRPSVAAKKKAAGKKPAARKAAKKPAKTIAAKKTAPIESILAGDDRHPVKPEESAVAPVVPEQTRQLVVLPGAWPFPMSNRS